MLAAGALLVSLATAPLGSHPVPIFGNAKGHVQIGVLAGLHGTDRFGSLEVQASASALFLGLAAGVGYTRLPAGPSGGGSRSGARVELAFQLRPGQLHPFTRRYFDAYLSFGGVVGGVADAGARFRGASFLGVGVDIPLLAAKVPLALCFLYRRFFQQSPDGVPQNHLAFGVAWRRSF